MLGLSLVPLVTISMFLSFATYYTFGPRQDDLGWVLLRETTDPVLGLRRNYAPSVAVEFDHCIHVEWGSFCAIPDGRLAR